MLESIDIANHTGTLLCYCVPSEGGVPGTVTLFLKFGSAMDGQCSCLKLRFSKQQFGQFQWAIASPEEFPGYDLAQQKLGTASDSR